MGKVVKKIGGVANVLFGKKSLTGRTITPFRKGVQSVGGFFSGPDSAQGLGAAAAAEPAVTGTSDVAGDDAAQAERNRLRRRRQARGRGSTILTGTLGHPQVGSKRLTGA